MDIIRNFAVNYEIGKEDEWFKEKYFPSKNAFYYIIKAKKEKKEIGAVGLYDINFGKGIAEFGRIFIGEKEFQGKGFAMEASKLVIRHGFEIMNLKEIFLTVFESNPTAINLYESLGFKKTGKEEEWTIKHDNNRKDNLIYMNLTSKEFKEIKDSIYKV